MGECKINKLCFKNKPICCGECDELNNCEVPCGYMDFIKTRNPRQCDCYMEVQDEPTKED